MVHHKVYDIGDSVFCDRCGTDYTKSDESGGFLFGSYAYCPKCAEKSLPQIRRCGEEHFIKDRCPEGTSFADWCRRLRGGNNPVVITTWSDDESRPDDEGRPKS